MRTQLPCLAALAALLASGCMLVRAPLVEGEDGGADAAGVDDAGRDAPGLDAPERDAPAIDAPELDAPAPDAGEPDAPAIDARDLDAPAIDGGGALDAPDAPRPTDAGCSASSTGETACDRLDEDCDGAVDDDGVCGGCVAITVGARVFLSCPGPASGLEAWAGACRTTAEGYDLATFGSAEEQAAVQAALRAAGVDQGHWIGLNDFDENGVYVWRDRARVFTPDAIGADDPQKRCVWLRETGELEELPCSDSHRLLCEAVLPPGPCAADAEAPTCNGIDDNCDGRVDEAIDCGAWGCTSFTFWDSVYYACTDALGWDDARAACTSDARADLAVLNAEIERTYLGARTAESWMGLRQANGSGAPNLGWRWLGDTSVFALPPMGAPWDGGSGGQPDDDMPPEDDQQNCGSLRGDANFEDDACADVHDFVCEQTWRW